MSQGRIGVNRIIAGVLGIAFMAATGNAVTAIGFVLFSELLAQSAIYLMQKWEYESARKQGGGDRGKADV